MGVVVENEICSVWQNSLYRPEQHDYRRHGFGLIRGCPANQARPGQRERRPSLENKGSRSQDVAAASQRKTRTDSCVAPSNNGRQITMQCLLRKFYRNQWKRTASWCQRGFAAFHSEGYGGSDRRLLLF